MFFSNEKIFWSAETIIPVTQKMFSRFAAVFFVSQAMVEGSKKCFCIAEKRFFVVEKRFFVASTAVGAFATPFSDDFKTLEIMIFQKRSISTAVSVIQTAIWIAPTAVFGIQKMFSNTVIIFSAAETAVEILATMFFAFQTAV